MADLRVIAGGHTDPANVADAEVAVLARASSDMTEWIDRLPTTSEWRWAFIRARRDLVQHLAEREA